MSTSVISANRPAWRDWIGVVASIGCAIHCAAMPFVIAYLPGLGLSFLADEAFHKWMFLVCVLIGLSAFIPGWRKHGRWLPITIGSAGLTFIGFAAFGLAGECCAACEDGTELSGHETGAACCENGCCVFEQDDDQQHSETLTAVETAEQPLLGASIMNAKAIQQIAPWITPLGGFLLVVAHLLNRRFGCLCGCCATRDEDASLLSSIET